MATFEREDWTLFRTLGTLGQEAGVSVDLLPRLVVKELADNALDHSGSVTVDLIDGVNGFTVADWGDGLPGSDEEIGRLFSIRRPLLSTKLLRLPTRGALGNGLRVVTGAVLATGGDLRVATRGRWLKLTPRDDGTTTVTRIGDYADAGTRIDVILGDALPVDVLALKWAINASVLAAGESYKGKTSPFWYDADSFFELLQAAGDRPVRELVAEFDGCSGAKAGKIAAGLLGRACASLGRDDAETLLAAARTLAKPVKAGRLGGVGDGVLPGGYARVEGSFTVQAGQAALAAVLPVVVEAWACVDDQAGDRPTLTVAVNKSPITVPVDAWLQKTQLALSGAGLHHVVATVGRAKLDNVAINVMTPYMPITSHGKAPDLLRVIEPLAEAVETAIKRAKSGRRTAAPRRQSQKEIVFANLDAARRKASQNGRYRFSQRQLFYALRPTLIELTGKEPEYDTITRILTDYENEFGDIAGMYRDDRGTLYHPHLREDIALGTLGVEAYRRPEWTFNKILYIEKEGFFGILKAEQWPERHDCALLTSKGQATRAAKDLLDLLGETDEELTFFCVHDADAYGTLIYQALQEGTRTRPSRKVEIVNLGLDPWEGIEMGLQVEAVTSEKRRHPVGAYITPKWETWLQTQRIELNAMPTDVFLDWLDRKMHEHGDGKLIPPDGVRRETLAENVQTALRDKLTARILEREQLDAQVETALAGVMANGFDAQAGALGGLLRDRLQHHPALSWRAPLVELAQEMADKHLTG